MRKMFAFGSLAVLCLGFSTGCLFDGGLGFGGSWSEVAGNIILADWAVTSAHHLWNGLADPAQEIISALQ